ncbi:metalloproteinase inhibitor 1-like [Crotalus adamanteus]|uniref:Metalloproteinase inhibitor 1 n=1 Tax=Crotalus adamanteus TaxID=8729 RepID=A0AAW1BZJ4_CROAD
MLLGDLTEACSCERLSLRKACCQHDFVMRVLFMGVQRDPDSPSYIHINKFSIRPVQVFKGSGRAVNAQFLYSPESDSLCGYEHKGPFQEDDYLISGGGGGGGGGAAALHHPCLQLRGCSPGELTAQVSARESQMEEGRQAGRQVPGHGPCPTGGKALPKSGGGAAAEQRVAKAGGTSRGPCLCPSRADDAGWGFPLGSPAEPSWASRGANKKRPLSGISGQPGVSGTTDLGERPPR